MTASVLWNVFLSGAINLHITDVLEKKHISCFYTRTKSQVWARKAQPHYWYMPSHGEIGFPMNMWEVWILLLASNFMTAHFLTEPLSTLNHLEVTYGQQLGIMLSSVTEKLEFTSTNSLQSIIIWSGRNQVKRGEVVKSGEEKRFIIKSVTFNDQGNYTEWDFWDKVTTVNLVKVTSKRLIQGCMPDKNLSISLDGLLKNEVTLQFSSKDFIHTLVKHGLPMDNQIPGYWGRIQVTTKNIQVFIVDGSDVGKYTLSDHENNTVMILTLNMGGCELQTTQLKLKHGEELSINLPIWFKKLEFSSVNKVQSVLWPSCELNTKKYVKGSGYERDYIIRPVTFDDEGTYTRWNYKNKESSIYKLDVVCANHIQDCVVGKTLSIFLDGLAKDDVTLHFTNQDLNITLVEHGSPVGNLNHFSERIQVTSSDIQVLNIDVTDMGNYTLFDREDRMVKVIRPNIIYKRNPLLALLLLLFIPLIVFCCYGDKIKKKCTKSKTTNNNTTGRTVKYKNENSLLPTSGQPSRNPEVSARGTLVAQ